MNLDTETRSLAKQEKELTAKILKNLALIDRDKLYSDYGYPTLFKYLTKALGYTDAEAYVRVAAVKLIRVEKKALKKIEEGSLSLSNAAEINSTLSQLSKTEKITKEVIEKALDLTDFKSTRQAKENLRLEFRPQEARSENIKLDERILEKMDRVRKSYQEELSTYELIDILLEEKLKTPTVPARTVSSAVKNSRYIPRKVKYQVYDGKCARCSSRRNLEYDHIQEFSLGGDNSLQNIQLLCRNCNQRKNILLNSNINKRLNHHH
jgi:5-methylcytosine-specific restriction endonuclease McrA